jgi:hypothetical protein
MKAVKKKLDEIFPLVISKLNKEQIKQVNEFCANGNSFAIRENIYMKVLYNNNFIKVSPYYMNKNVEVTVRGELKDTVEISVCLAQAALNSIPTFKSSYCEVNSWKYKVSCPEILGNIEPQDTLL